MAAGENSFPERGRMSNGTTVPPFAIKDCALVSIATGKRAGDLRELAHYAQIVSLDSIYHHFWGARLQPSLARPEYHNDFAAWVHKALHDDIMAERLSIIDPTEHTTLEGLQQELVQVIEERLDEIEYPRWAAADRQFEFIRSQMVIFDTHHTAEHPRDLVTLMPHISVGSIFYHFIDGRRRNPERQDDFTRWIESFGPPESEVCQKLQEIDPYFSTLTELRADLTKVLRDFFGEAVTDLSVEQLPPPFPRNILQEYAQIAGQDVVDHLRQLAQTLQGKRVVHVNSTRVGGGVAEMLYKMVPLMRELGLDASWEVIGGKPEFYQCTKAFHNALQGDRIFIPEQLLRSYEETNARNAEQLAGVLSDADIVIIHDPQPAAMIDHLPERKGKWIWRCHIDVSKPHRPVWRYLRRFIAKYDASIFSLQSFAQMLPHPIYLVPPSIDPLNDKNRELDEEEIRQVYSQFAIDPDRPMILQVSRYDRFKDPLGVIQAFKLAKRFIPNLQLVLAGGTATDDPEGELMLNEVRSAAADDPDIHVLLLPGEAHRTINALQRAADIVLQKSIKEGFGLTVTEAMWKGKPVIGGDTGGIRIQVFNHHTGFLVNTPEGAALRIRYLFHNRPLIAQMGQRAKEFVRDNYLVTRHLREYLTMMVGISSKEERIQLG